MTYSFVLFGRVHDDVMTSLLDVSSEKMNADSTKQAILGKSYNKMKTSQLPVLYFRYVNCHPLSLLCQSYSLSVSFYDCLTSLFMKSIDKW